MSSQPVLFMSDADSCYMGTTPESFGVQFWNKYVDFIFSKFVTTILKLATFFSFAIVALIL